MRRIAAAQAPFASRGDDSGTNRMELRLWTAAGIIPPKGGWYRDVGSGMGETLNTAAAMDAYTLTDRATWAAFHNRGNLVIVLERDSRLLNPYSSILVNPARHPGVKADLARIWHQWLTGPEGQRTIAAYAIDGEQLFFPDAKTP
jgi:tungstate transport system substrate-binding protein